MRKNIVTSIATSVAIVSYVGLAGYSASAGMIGIPLIDGSIASMTQTATTGQALTVSGGVIQVEQTDITKVMDASTKAIQSGFGVLDFLGVIALIVGAGFVLRYILGLIPKALSGGGGSSK